VTGPDPGVSRETLGPAPDWPAWLAPAADGLAAYARLLAGAGVERGLIGPREVPRLWDRHLLNCAVVADPAVGLVPDGVTVADIGSGAGLPGLVWALARPDLRVVLVEPLLRRATFLSEAVAALGLGDRVEVRRARAEELSGGLADVVTARAVAPLDRLAVWTMPLVRVGGSLVALKGASVEDEVAAAGALVRALGGTQVEVVRCGVGVVEPPTTVVRVVRGAAGSAPTGRAGQRRRTR
jgi:16S rRNA (guanine527-N7)-methyltransferase